jgi:hypothetical protein
VLEIAARFSSVSEVAIIHIYCQFDQPATLTAPGIISSLIKQLLSHLESLGKAIDPKTQDQLSKAERHGRTQLDAEEGFDILLRLVQRFSKTFLIIDGLDECNSGQESGHDGLDDVNKILRFAKRLLKLSSATIIKIFLSSRLEADVSRYIPDCYQVSVSKSHMNGDIATFVEDEVEDKIWAAGRTDDYSLVQDIKRELVNGAQGM